jgi:hypothetical protein
MAVCASAGFASFSASDAGTATAQFLKLGAGARPAGMGEAFGAVVDDATAIYWNPAGLSRIEGKSLSVMHAVWFESVAYDWLSYAQKAGDLGTFGIGIQYLGYGSITETDETGLEAGNFSPSDLAVSLSYGRTIKGFGVGANVKYISSRIKSSASAYVVDLGVQRALMNDKLLLGFALQNLGTAMKFVEKEDVLPLNAKLGGAYRIKGNWTVALDINMPQDNTMIFGAGTEYVQSINKAMSLAGRLGYNTRAKDTGGLNGISAVLGFNYLTYTLDYAFVPYGELGNTHRISLGIKF